MRLIPIIIALFFTTASFAKPLISPIDAMKSVFGKACDVSKKNILLNHAQAAAVQKAAKLKLKTKIYRFYTASSAGKALGYGILVTRKVRQKDAAVLYMIAPSGTIAAIEIIAFNEPPEYMPQPTYIDQFKHKSAADTLRVGKDIPAISGATLSARNITDGARLALALFDTVIGKRK